LKLLIGGSPSKFFHLEEFKICLQKFNIETKLVVDTDILDGFPSKNFKKWFQSKKKFNNLIEKFQPDVIFVDRQHTLFNVATVETKIPVLVHLRGNYWSEVKWAKETLYKGTIKKKVIDIKNKRAERCFRNSFAILPICNYLKKIVDKRFPGKKVNVLYQGIDPKKWYSVNGMKLEHPCVGLVQSASIWGKTKEMLILEKILSSLPNVTFYWVGDGPYRDQITSKLSKYDNFKWLGHLQYPDKVREFLSEIDIYALVSGIDMSPLTLLEAQLMKKPVISTNVGGISELMKDNDTGFLVEKGDNDEWVKKISFLINNSSQAKKMGEKGRIFVKENFSWDKIAEQFVEFLIENKIMKRL